MDVRHDVQEVPALLDLAAAKAQIAKLEAPPRLDLAPELRAAAASGVKGRRLFRDLLQARRGPGRLTTHEYFYYRLHDTALPPGEIGRFVGKRTQNRFHAVCNDVRWFAVTHDKALFYAAASGIGLPVPRTRAVYAPGQREFAAETIRTPEALAAFLRDPAHYPLFAKPIEGIYSIGALSLAALDGDRVRFTSGETAGIDTVVGFIAGLGGKEFRPIDKGFLLQDRLAPHPALQASFGSTLPTIRFLVLLSAESVSVESAVLKVPSTRNPADNYWRAGNMLAALDASGTLQRAVTGVGAALREEAVHPDTGTPLVGLTVPEWDGAVKLCRRAAAMFPAVRTQSWDVALTDAGPVLLEFNFGGDLNLHQLAHRRGMLTPTYVAHLQSCGVRGLK